jgi:N-glycosylase/DNA lyase
MERVFRNSSRFTTAHSLTTVMSNIVPLGFKALPLSIDQLCLSAVLKCGQSFRWSTRSLASRREDAGLKDTNVSENPTPEQEYRFCLKDRVICLQQSSDTLFYKALFPDEEDGASSSSVFEGREKLREEETLQFVRDYFQLDVDLVKLYEEWGLRDPVFRGVRGRFAGIRMLRQDPWECLISCVLQASRYFTCLQS